MTELDWEDQDPFTEPSEPAEPDPGDGMGLWALTRDTIVRPSRAMTRLAARPGRRWVVPIVVLALLSVATAIVQLPAASDYREAVALAQSRALSENNPDMLGGMSPEEIAAMSTAGPAKTMADVLMVVGPLVGVLVAVFVGAAVLHFLGTILGGQQTYTQMLTVTSWARVPLILGATLQLVGAALGNFDPNPRGLQGLFAPDPLDSEAQRSFLEPLAAEVELWNLWYLVLLVIAVYVASRVSRGKAVAAVLIYVLLRVALGETGVAFARFISGAFGG